MRPKKIRQFSSEELSEFFRSSVAAYFDTIDAGGKRKDIDEASKPVWACVDELASRGDEERLILSGLLHDEHPGVRLYAAREVEQLFPEEALAVYEEVANSGGAPGVSALASLDRVKGVDSLSGPPPLLP